jgi:hypothetical protein
MAFDAMPGGDPRGRICPRCNNPILPGQPTTHMQFREDPHELLGYSGKWHGECARPYWDTVTPILKRMEQWGAGVG